MMKPAIMAGFGVALALLTTPAEAARAYCEGTVTERLDRLKVDPSDVRSIYYDLQRQTRGDNDRVVGILAWVRLRSCKGYLVIDMSVRCRVRQVYGRGECDLGGAVDAWR